MVEGSPINTHEEFSYVAKKRVMTKAEQEFFTAIRYAVPTGYYVFPQMNLAVFVDKIDGSKYRNELFRNVDFLITDGDFKPRVAIEINDGSHETYQRRERDKKVRQILGEAGIPLVTLWSRYGVNNEYINKKVREALTQPIMRKGHIVEHNNTPCTSHMETQEQITQNVRQINARKKGCYIATCVYGSYDCPQVWVLRRYRDRKLAASVAGRIFIRLYYAVSPRLVSWFGNCQCFHRFFKYLLDIIVGNIRKNGYEDTPYRDD